MRVDVTELELRHLAEDLDLNPDDDLDLEFASEALDRLEYIHDRDERIDTPWTRLALLPKFKMKGQKRWYAKGAETYFTTLYGGRIIGSIFETARFYCCRLAIKTEEEARLHNKNMLTWAKEM